MPGGRPPKPRALKALHGDRRDRINDGEPVPAAGDVVPSWPLSSDAQAVWDRLAPERIATGVLTSWDVDAFGMFCELVPLARRKLAAADAPPRPGAATGLGELRTVLAALGSLGSRFGWTPADGSGLVVGVGEQEPDDLLTG